MNETDDLYAILQVTPSAEPEVIQAAYRRLTLKYHPDRNKSPEAAEIMKRLNNAYETLRDPAKRVAYDRARAARSRSRATGTSQNTYSQGEHSRTQDKRDDPRRQSEQATQTGSGAASPPNARDYRPFRQRLKFVPFPLVALVGLGLVGLSIGLIVAQHRGDGCADLMSNTAYKGTISNQTAAMGGDITATFNQANCGFSGFLKISPPLIGSGKLEGQVNGNRANFVINGRTNDAGRDLVFEGTVSDRGLSGNYVVPITGERGTWELMVTSEAIRH